MAGDEPHSTTADPGDAPRTSIEDHKRTFDAFLGLTKWGIIGVVILLIGMAVFLL